MQKCSYLHTMYDVKHFKAADNGEVLQFMQAHPFVTICGIGSSGFPVASHIPVLLEEREGKTFVLGHVMRKQEHSEAFESNPNVLVIFSGNHSYVSASWYTEPATASTWNYQAVHAQGRLRFLDDAGLHDLLTRLTLHFEVDKDSPALVEKMPVSYVQQLMRAIMAFEIELTRVDHIFKLSQNKNEASYHQVISELSKGDEAQQSIAATMQDRAETVFPPSPKSL